MKKIYLSFLMLSAFNFIQAQFVNYEVEIIAVERTNYSDCGGCGAPDPTWIIDLNDNASAAIDNVGIHVPGNGTVFTNVNFALTNRVNSNASSFTLALDAWEDNCNNDVFNFNNYNFFTCFPSVFGDDRRCTSSNVANVNFRTFAPCQWHSAVSAQCNDYKFTYRFRWNFNQAPVIATQPSPIDNNLCLGTPITFSASTTLDPNGWNTGNNYQWQVSTVTDCASATAGSWTNVGGANAASFTPAQTPGTRLYRVLITSNCGSNFVSNTVASNCVRVTYNPYGVPGDLPPDIQSGICGSVVLPGSTHPLDALLPPAVGAANGVTYAWTTTGGSFSAATGSSTVWTAPTTAGNYTVTLTYQDACSQADATTTCVVDVGSPNCDFAYVSTTGTDDVFAGGPDNPYQSLAYAISQLAGRKYIRMDGGTYNETNVIQLEDDLIIEGGYEYSAGIWIKKSTEITSLVLNGFQNSATTGNASIEHRVGIFGDNDDDFTLQDLTISTNDISGVTSNNRGRSNYAVLLINGCENYNIIRCSITSGDASRGSNGTTPGNSGGSIGGSGGGSGGSGANGSGNPSGGSSGGSGQNAPYSAATHPSYVFPVGANGTGGNGGNATDNCPGGSGCGFFGPSDSGCNGNQGVGGTIGANGRSWQVNDRPIVSLSNIPYYIPGSQAGSGQNGGGGGQGAGGNGSRGGQSAPLCIDCDGRNGGTGGNGGTAGRGGSGGFGAGGSFGIYTNNSSIGANITNIDITIPSAVATGGTGASGSSGVNGSNGSSGSCNGCVLPGTRCSGAGGNGARGGDGGRGRDGSNGENAHLVVDGVASNPSTSIPSFPIVSIEYNNAKACINSEINLTKDGPNSWSLSLPYVNDLSGAPAPLVTSSYSNGSPEVQVYSTVPGQVVNLQVGGSVFNSYLTIADDVRALPNITVNPSNLNCIGSTVNVSASSWGTEVEYDWRIYEGTDVDNPSLSPSTLASPSFNLAGLNSGLYTLRYRVREVCCGWSIPVYDTIRIIDEPIIYQVSGGGGYCAGSNGSIVRLSGSQSGVSYQLLLNGAPVDTVIGTGAPFDFAPQLVPGNYTVVGESIASCDNFMQGSVNIFVHPQPNDQDVLSLPYICSQGGNTSADVTLDDSEIGVSYQIFLNDTVPLGPPIPGNGFAVSFGPQTSAGQYTVLATNNTTTCSRYLNDTVTIVLFNGPTPYNLQGGGGFCAGTPGAEIDLMNSDTTVDYQLIWNHTVPMGSAKAGTNALIPFGFQSLEGVYTVIATDDLGCQVSMLDTLDIDELIVPTIQSVDVTGLTCVGDSIGVITVNATSFNGNLDYALNLDTNATGVFNNLPSGGYFVSVIDDSLCKTVYPFTPIQIEEPNGINISSKNIFHVSCIGGNDGEIQTEISGGTPPYTILWSPTGDTTQNIENLTAGVYTMQVTDANGCQASQVFVITEPDALQVSLSPTQPGCPGEQTGLASVGVNGGVAPYSYVWNTTPVQFGIVATQLFGDQWYTVEVTDANGCILIDSTFIQNPDTMTVDVLPGNSSCINGNDGFAYVEVTGGSAPFSYELNGFYQTDSAFSGLTAGSYFVFVEDNKGCNASSQFTITPTTALDVQLVGTSLSNLNTPDEIIVVSEEPVQLNANLLNSNANTQVVQYYWTPINEVDLSACNFDTLCDNPSIAVDQSTQVVVEVIELVNGVGCSAFDTLDIIVRTDFPFFFPTSFTPTGDCLNDYFEMNVAGAESLDVKIYNRWGELVFDNANQTNGPNDPSTLDCTNPRNAWDGSFNGQPAPIGAYVYQVRATYFNGDVEDFSGTITVLR